MESGHCSAASFRNMPALLPSTRHDGCFVLSLSPYKTQFQLLVHTSALYSRICVTAGWLPAGESGKWKFFRVCITEGMLCGGCGQCGMRHVPQAKSDLRHHRCHLRWQSQFPTLPCSWNRGSQVRHGLCCSLTTCPPANHLSSWASVYFHVI